MEGAAIPVPAATLIMGDFNLTQDSPEYTLLGGETDPIFGSLARADRVQDAWMIAGEGPGTTFEDEHGARRIDYIFCSADLAASLRSVSVITSAKGSDHLPVECEFRAAP